MAQTARAAPAAGAERAAPHPGRRAGPLRPILWRLHFLSGFLAAPVVVWLCLSGILYAWNPQIEMVLHREALTADGPGEPRPIWEQVAAVTGRFPHHRVVEVHPAAAGSGRTTAVLLQPVGAASPGGFAPATGAFTAYVDPATATLTGRIEESRRPDEWLRNLHSNFRLGEGGIANTLTELAGSLVLVSLATGLYLWWPATRRARRRAFRPRLAGLRRGGRRPWRDLHATVGVLTLGALAVLVVTGLTWTEYAGRWVDVARERVMPAPPTLDTALTGSAPHVDHSAHAGHGAATGDRAAGRAAAARVEAADNRGATDRVAGDGLARDRAPGTGFAGDQPAADRAAGHAAATGDGPTVRLDQLSRVVGAADSAGLSRPYTVTPPERAGQAWTVTDTDSRWPIRETTLAVDPATGRVVDRVRFADRPLLDQATTIGIAFHQAELFGPANQIGLTLLAVALLVSVVSGYVMWWRRRPAGALAVPPPAGPLLRTVPLPLLALSALTLVLLPTLAVALAAYLVAERAVRSRRRRPDSRRRRSSAPPVAIRDRTDR